MTMVNPVPTTKTARRLTLSTTTSLARERRMYEILEQLPLLAGGEVSTPDLPAPHRRPFPFPTPMARAETMKTSTFSDGTRPDSGTSPSTTSTVGSSPSGAVRGIHGQGGRRQAQGVPVRRARRLKYEPREPSRRRRSSRTRNANFLTSTRTRAAKSWTCSSSLICTGTRSTEDPSGSRFHRRRGS